MHCNAQMFEDEKLKSSSRNFKKFGLCCFEGKIVIPQLANLPNSLKELYENDDEISKYFRDHIRSFNSAFAMTSIGVHEAEIPGNGPPTFKIQGMIHHRIGSLLPLNNQQPRFIQIYFYETIMMLLIIVYQGCKHYIIRI